MMRRAVPTIHSVEEPPAWWRDPCEVSVLLRVADAGCMRTLTAFVARVAPLARDLAGLGRGETAGLMAHAVRRRPADSLATDLLGSVLLVEAAAGGAVARDLVDHMRRQRGLAPLAWPGRHAPTAVAARPSPVEAAAIPAP